MRVSGLLLLLASVLASPGCASAPAPTEEPSAVLEVYDVRDLVPSEDPAATDSLVGALEKTLRSRVATGAWAGCSLEGRPPGLIVAKATPAIQAEIRALLATLREGAAPR